MKVATSGTRAVAVAGLDVVAPFQELDRLHARVVVPSRVGRSGVVRPAQAVVEVRRGMGGVMWRALLGGTWVPEESDPPMVAVNLAVSAVPEASERIPDLLHDGHSLRPGLPEEFAAKVLGGLEEAVLAGGCPSGVLTVDRGAFDDESGGLIFAVAARVLVRVLLAIGAGADSLEAAVGEMTSW